MAKIISVGLIKTDMVFKKNGKRVFMIEVTKERFFNTSTKVISYNDDGIERTKFFTRKEAFLFIDNLDFNIPLNTLVKTL